MAAIFRDFRQAFDCLEDQIAIIDGQGVIVAANAAWQQFSVENGGEPDGFVGRNYFDVCPTEHEDAIVVAQGLRQVIAAGVEFRHEYACPSPTEQRWFELYARRMGDGGEPFAVVVHRNVTRRALEGMQARAARVNAGLFSALVASSNDAILSYDLDGKIMTWNPAAERLYGYRADEVIGRSLEIIYPDGWPKRITEYRDEIVAGALKSFEVVRRTKSGRERQIWVSAAPVYDASGQLVAVSNIHRDITEWRRHEQSRRMVAEEIVHRAKNMLTVIAALHRRTAAASTSLEDFNVRFGERIKSLATSTDFLTAGNWTTAPLAALIRSQTALFDIARSDRIEISGPEIDIRPQAVKVIGMALHELGTNALKHGALATDQGRVRIAWMLEDAPDGPGLAFEWLEDGVEPEAAPEGRGFGHTLLTNLAGSLLETAADYRIDPTGVRWRIVLPRKFFVVAGTAPSETGPGGWPSAGADVIG